MEYQHGDNGRILKIGCKKCEGMEEHEHCGEVKMKRKHVKKEGKYKCNECDKGFRNMK